MKRNAYTINHLTATVTVTKSFLKEAGIIGSPAYNEMLRLRRELPEYEISVHEAKKRTSDKPYGNLTYKKMEAYRIGSNAAPKNLKKPRNINVF